MAFKFLCCYCQGKGKKSLFKGILSVKKCRNCDGKGIIYATRPFKKLNESG
ncbi:hypothetical protein SAMN05192533_12149 [Mesobacillus persicus]|uniref:Molecular chaperone DnaJ n=1 Tax=Mesobacillus persicus TaxID=930146 RepID=A0A1H8JIJ0_9BACI|nr:hypothetical protein SAMN05192533_12149 [Mesobacillus persicus]